MSTIKTDYFLFFPGAAGAGKSGGMYDKLSTSFATLEAAKEYVMQHALTYAQVASIDGSGDLAMVCEYEDGGWTDKSDGHYFVQHAGGIW